MNLNSEKIWLLVSILVIFLVIFYMNKSYSYNDDMINKIKTDLLIIEPRSASLNFYASNESFTEDKKFVYLCLKDKNDQYYDYNMLIYVSLHEIAHAFSKEVDTHHTGDEFKNNFKKYLKIAEQKGLFDPNKPLDYSYCPQI